MMYCAAQALTSPATGDLVPEHILFGRSAAMQELKAKLSRFCNASVPILLQGEAGVGKKALSQFIHQRWFALHGRYARVSCASVDEHWAAFALCAVLKCSAPGPLRPETRLHPATLFLDEVNEFPGKLQRLLAILLGERKHHHGQDRVASPFCLVSSSTRNLRREMKAGHFRRDLLEQLAIGVLDVPPIRDRVQDLPDICEYMRRHCCMQAGVADRPFPHDLMERMLLYSWPGNLNELETFIRRFVALGPEYCGLIQNRQVDAVGFTGRWMM